MAKDMRAESYHKLHTQVFVSLWAAQEAGFENVVVEVVRFDCAAGQRASEKFKAGRYPLNQWPWPEQVCFDIAQKLDTKAKDATPDGGHDVSERLRTLFGWFDIDMTIEPSIAAKYNKAAVIPNSILHRYGRLSERDVQDSPALSAWIGRVVPMTQERFAS